MNAPAAINRASRIPATSEITGCRLGLTSFDPTLFCATPRPNQKRSLSTAVKPSSARLRGSMLTTAVNLPARRAPSPQIRARDTSLDGTTNGSAGVDSAPDVDAGVNAAPHLGGHCCGDHHGNSTNYRKLAEHNPNLPWAQTTDEGERDLCEPLPGQLPPWRRRTNVWRRITK